MEMRCGSETGKIQTKKRCFRMMMNEKMKDAREIINLLYAMLR